MAGTPRGALLTTFAFVAALSGATFFPPALEPDG